MDHACGCTGPVQCELHMCRLMYVSMPCLSLQGVSYKPARTLLHEGGYIERVTMGEMFPNLGDHPEAARSKAYHLVKHYGADKFADEESEEDAGACVYMYMYMYVQYR